MSFKIKKYFSKFLFRIAFAIIVIGALAVWYLFGVMSPLYENVSFRVSRGDGVSAVANRLYKQNIIAAPQLFEISVRLHGGMIRAGEYDIPAGTSAWHVGHILSRGEIATTTILVPEGLTVKQIKNLLLNSSELSGPVECISIVNKPVCNLRDGDLFPDTYRVARGESRLALLELMRKKMDDVKQSWQKSGEIKPRPLKNWGEIITLASIVQRETPRASEMPRVASVYLNRLRRNMKLQADPTVVYAITDGLGDMRGAPLLRSHLKTNSPYNTYQNFGLPPTPIANVGRAAIRAVLSPADTNYLYFVADGTGGHSFSNTYEEHLKNHQNWREIKKMRQSAGNQVTAE